jgi:hypothetical protein
MFIHNLDYGCRGTGCNDLYDLILTMGSIKRWIEEAINKHTLYTCTLSWSASVNLGAIYIAIAITVHKEAYVNLNNPNGQ